MESRPLPDPTPTDYGKNRARCARTFTLLPFYENFLPGQAFTILIANGRIFTVPRDYVSIPPGAPSDAHRKKRCWSLKICGASPLFCRGIRIGFLGALPLGFVGSPDDTDTTD